MQSEIEWDTEVSESQVPNEVHFEMNANQVQELGQSAVSQNLTTAFEARTWNG